MNKCRHTEGCSKNDQGGGFCKSHGGGYRCKLDHCSKFAKVKGYCIAHSKKVAPIQDKEKNGDASEVPVNVSTMPFPHPGPALHEDYEEGVIAHLHLPSSSANPTDGG